MVTKNLLKIRSILSLNIILIESQCILINVFNVINFSKLWSVVIIVLNLKVDTKCI